MTDLHTPHKLAEAIAIEGRKGGEAKQHTPTEQPDSAASIDLVKMLFALGEGEWEGGITDRDIYLNDTPLANADGTRNFQNVQWEFRAGTVDQDYIQGIPAVDNETSVGVELKDDPYVYSASNRELSALRVRLQWPSIYKFLDNGDQVGYRIEYAIDLATGSGSYQQVHTGVLDDKATSTYSRTIRVDLPEYQEGGWRLRVRRLTAPANSNKIADTMRVAAVSEVIDAKLRYPNTALLFVQFDASTFQGTPQVSVMAKGRKVRVPSNYDPESRTYSGTWDGSFVSRYTTNPTWHWYDIVLNRRFGLGRRIDATMVNKWALYRIAQYCDQAVPNGLGGTEPRFTCNVYLQSQAEAWTVLRDISAIFRGMTYWSGSEMVVDADMPADVVYTFSPSNIEGDFDYVASPWRDRYSITAVKWDNPENNFKTETKPVPNLRAQARYGVRQADISAIGCTSVSEAGRRGEWVNTTSYLETNTVTFQTGVEGRGIAPGKLIAVADPDLAGKPMGGRISSVQSRRQVTLDREPTDLAVGDVLRLNMPSGVAQIRTVSAVAGRSVTVSAAFGEDPAPEAQWSVERQDLKTQIFRVLSVVDGDPPLRKITAIQHNESKFDAIDRGARIEVPPVTSIPAGSLAAPAEVRVAQNVFTAQGLAVTTMSVTWDRVEGAIKYEVQWRRDNGSWVTAGVVSTAGLDVQTVYAGVYVARVRAVSSMDIYSIWTESEPTGLQGKTDPPPVLASLTADSAVFSIVLRWTFPAGMSDDVAYTELQYGVSQDEQAAVSLGLFGYPTDTHTLMGLASGQAFNFRGRLRDRSGNVGAWTPWVRGTSSAAADEILDYLEGQITESQLGQDLLAPIKRIDAPADVAGSINARIKEARDALQADIDDVQRQVDNIGDLADAQEYKPTEAYKAGAIVTVDNALYQAKVDVAAASDGSNAPPKTTLWRDAGGIIREGDGLATRVSSLSQTVTTQGNSITANSSDISQLKTSVAGKADSSALQALQSTVTSQGNTITSQGSSITSLQNSLPNLGGENQLYNSSFDVAGSGGLPEGWVKQGTASATPGLVASTLNGRGYAARLDCTGLSTSVYAELATATARRFDVVPGRVVTLSVSLRATAGLRWEIYVVSFGSNGLQIGTASGKGGSASGSWERQTVTASPPTDAVKATVYLRIVGTASLSSGFVEFDDAQVEPGSVATAWRDNVQATGAALQALTSRVTTAEGTITSQGSSITNLQNSLTTTRGDVSGLQTSVSGLQSTVTSQGNTITSQGSAITALNSSVKGAVQQAFNIVPNPTFDPAFNQMGFTVVPSTTSGVPANCPFPYVMKTRLRDNFPSIDALPNVPVKAGDVWRFTALVAAEANSGTKPFQHYASKSTSPSGGRTAYANSPMTSVTQTWTRVTWDHTIPAGVTFFCPFLQIETNGSDTATWYVTDWHCENVTAAKQAQATADAAASAVTTLGSRVDATEKSITAQASSITKLQSDVSGIAGLGAFTAAVNFEFLSSLRGAYLEQAASGATLTAYQQNATINGYANFRLPTFAATNGAQNYLVKMRVRVAGGTRNPGRIYWANEDGGLSEARTATFALDLNNKGWQDIVIDLGANTAWATKTGNNSIRFDFLNSQDTGATVDIAYIAVGRPAASASATALNETQTQVTQQGSAITALTTATQSLTAQLTMDLTGDDGWNIGDDTVYAGQITVQSVAADQTQAVSKRTDSLQAQLGINTAAILEEVSARTTAMNALASRTSALEASVGDGIDALRAQVDTTSKAVASLDGKVSASQVTRVQVTANGVSYAAGFAIGVDYSGGVTSSQFLVQADTFGVLNGTGNAQTSLVFSIVGGVSYLRQAMIQQGTIQNLIVGANLTSAAYTQDGSAPIFTLNMNTGEMIVRHVSNGSYIHIRHNGVYLVQGGVAVVEMSLD